MTLDRLLTHGEEAIIHHLRHEQEWASGMIGLLVEIKEAAVV